jgi:hypothetical protein
MDRDGEIQRKREKDRYSDIGSKTDVATDREGQIQRQREVCNSSLFPVSIE